MDSLHADAAPALPPRALDAPSVFRPEHLLREARRQKGLPEIAVPAVCVLDPDGDLVRHLRTTGRGRVHQGWACYHTELLAFALEDGTEVGVVGCAVGAPFAVLVAEQLFASGCRLVASITSAGRIVDVGEPPYFVLIERALCDEGTSGHYVAAGAFMPAPDPALLERVWVALGTSALVVHRGASWTTDAPYRETEAAIGHAAGLGVLAVEMEAAALYALGAAQSASVICFAHVTNTMGREDGADFEKGEADGALASIRVIEAAVAGLRRGA